MRRDRSKYHTAIMSRFLRFWWRCVSVAGRGNIAFANSWQWLFGFPIFSGIIGFIASRVGVASVTTGSPILDGLLISLGSFLATWSIAFIVRLVNAPVMLFYAEKERADRLDEIKRQLANGAISPSFDLGFEAIPINGDKVQQFHEDRYYSLFDFPQSICRIWVENMQSRPVDNCRVAVERFGPASPVKNGALLIPDNRGAEHNRTAHFQLAATERKYFKFLELSKPIDREANLDIIVVSDQDATGSLAFIVPGAALEFNTKYFATIAVHGDNANSRRLNLMIDVISDTEVVVTEVHLSD